MAKAIAFVDGSWLCHAKDYISAESQYSLDYGKLRCWLKDEAAKVLDEQTSMVRVHLYGSYPTNVHPDDEDVARRHENFYGMLRDRYSYEVEAYPVDFRGQRVTSERDWEPQEKCVDVALASGLLGYVAMPGAMDVACVVLGDRDFFPALERARDLGKRVLVFSVRASCCRDLHEVSDAPVIWLDDHADDLALQRVERELKCESPLHEGGRTVVTTHVPVAGERFFCAECRKRYASQRDAGHRHSAPVGSEIRGVVKAVYEGRGFGFATGEDCCDYFFHASDLRDGLVLEELECGQEVRFEVKRQPVADKAGAVEWLDGGSDG